MRIVPAIAWTLDGEPAEPLDPRLLPLLEAIAATASLYAAVAACGISYRAGWGLLRAYEARLRVPLATLARGRGTALAPAGQRLLDAQRAATRRLERFGPALAVELGPTQRSATAAAREAVLPLRVAASHDLALAALAEAAPAGARLALELAVMGSLPALAEYAAGRADVAGFHVAIDASGDAWRPFRRLLRPRRDRLLCFVDREQGLILPRGNPAQVRSFGDVAAKRLRFVNRQPGSGTRLEIDRLLAAEGVDAAALPGYRREEFTHAAVAATVASGGADVGFGVRAAAAEYRLAFVPLARERYYLALRERDAASPALQRLAGALASPWFARLVRRLPGCDASVAGAPAAVPPLPRARPA